MKPATKHWLFLVLLAVTLAALIAFALWQMEKARCERGITKYEIRMMNELRNGNVEFTPYLLSIAWGGACMYDV